MTYPNGSIASINDFLTIEIGSPYWIASRKFKSIEKYIATQIIGTEVDENYRYHWFDAGKGHKRSMQDVNIIPNGYNDWYVFISRGAALEYMYPEV